MPELSERHEIRIRGKDYTIVFIADSEDGRLVIRQEPDGRNPRMSARSRSQIRTSYALSSKA